jgi:hypothetical protein
VTENVQLFLVAVILSSLEIFESAVVRKQSTVVFSPKAGWRFFYFIVVVLLVFRTIYYLLSAHRAAEGAPLWWFPLLLAILLLVRPKTLVVNSTGLASYSWYGLRRRFIPWTGVSSVTSDWEEERLTYNLLTLLWVFTGYSITVAGQDATRIVHTILMRDQRKFLDVLRQHVPASVFAPGLFDWHP